MTSSRGKRDYNKLDNNPRRLKEKTPVKPPNTNVTLQEFDKDLDQRWATLYGSRATLETSLVCRFHYYLFNLNFESKWAFSSSFSKAFF